MREPLQECGRFRTDVPGELRGGDRLNGAAELGDGIVGRGQGAVSGGAFDGEIQPGDPFFRDLDGVKTHSSLMNGEPTDLVDDIFGLIPEQIGAFVDEPFGAESCPCFFIRYGDKNHVAVDREVLLLQLGERGEGHHRKSFHVDRTTSPDALAIVVTGPGGMAPAFLVGRHGIYVAAQEEWPAGAVRGIGDQFCDQIWAFFVGPGDLGFDADHFPAVLGKKINRGDFVPGRIAGIDAQECLEQLRGG